MFRFLLLCILGVGSPLYASTLLIFGDSLSAGYQLPAEASWPSLLASHWQQEGRDLHVINASVSGETTQGGAARLGKALAEHKPDWVLIELGANDGLRGLPPAQTRQHLETMLNQIQQHHAKGILTQIRLPPNYGARYINQFEALYPALAKQYQVPLMPFFMESIVTHPDWLLGDGMHPNAEGQKQILNQVQPWLADKLLKK